MDLNVWKTLLLSMDFVVRPEPQHGYSAESKVFNLTHYYILRITQIQNIIPPPANTVQFCVIMYLYLNSIFKPSFIYSVHKRERMRTCMIVFYVCLYMCVCSSRIWNK